MEKITTLTKIVCNILQNRAIDGKNYNTSMKIIARHLLGGNSNSCKFCRMLHSNASHQSCRILFLTSEMSMHRINPWVYFLSSSMKIGLRRSRAFNDQLGYPCSKSPLHLLPTAFTTKASNLDQEWHQRNHFPRQNMFSKEPTKHQSAVKCCIRNLPRPKSKSELPFSIQLCVIQWTNSIGIEKIFFFSNWILCFNAIFGSWTRTWVNWFSAQNLGSVF